MRAEGSHIIRNVEEETEEVASNRPCGKPQIKSEKHDILYSKARYVLHQRHIKRPWFNLNPFLEKTDETLDLDNFLPEESKYIQRLESLVLSESYSNDLPLDTRELALGVFFEYLNSDQWENGCSIRVLEGQLLDQLLIGLYRLERDNVTTRHTTYAFARNKRQITGCYKLADKESHGIRKETLLIEFAYFGRLTKDSPNTCTQNPLEYLREGVAEWSDDDMFPADSVFPPIQRTNSSSTQVKRRGRAQSIQVEQFDSYNLNDTTKPETPKWGRRGSLMSKHVNAIGFVHALSKPQIRRKSIAIVPSALPNFGASISPLSMLDGQQEKRRDSGASTSDDSKGRRRKSSVATHSDVPALTNRQKKVAITLNDYPTDFDEDVPSPPNSSSNTMREINAKQVENDENEEFYGHELYLTDLKSDAERNKESTRKKLRRKKKERDERRTELKDEREEIAKYWNKSSLPLPPLPLDMGKIQDSVKAHHTIKLPDKLPTFEELIDLYKEDEYFDPRYRHKIRLRSKIIAQRYYIAQGMHRTSIMFNLENLPNDIKYVGLTKRYMQQRAGVVKPPPVFNRKRRSSNGSGSKSNVMLPPLHESGRRTPKKTGVSSNLSITSSQRFAEEVHGVTDSEPCKEHCLKPKGSFNRSKEDKVERLRVNGNNQEKRARTSLAVSGHDVVLTTLTEEKSDQCLKPIKPSSSVRISQASPMFQKAELNDDDSESPDTDTDESNSGSETPSLFDGTKVNIRYSIERLRRKRRLKKKKPAFMEILSKYCNTHVALKAFRKGSGSREGKNVRDKMKKFGRAKKGKAKETEGREFIIGKLRKFPFNDVQKMKRLTLESLSLGDFSKADLTKFHEDLRKAIDEFVVRREIVVSDKQTLFRPATSVTFTRKSCFQKKHVDL